MRRRHALTLAGCALAVAAAEPLIPVSFLDVSRESGVDFVLENEATENKHQIETMVGGVGVIDFDNDGLEDLYFAGGASIPALEKTRPAHWNRLYRNEGGFRFRDVTEKAGVAGAGYSMAVAVGDYDNDGFSDLFVAGVNRNILYHNNGDGTFTDVTARAGLAGDKAQ